MCESSERTFGVVSLASHPSARDKAVANVEISRSSIISSTGSLVTVLNASEKGRRCDTCHQVDDRHSLRKCSGCASYWYCDAECQNLNWKAHHKRICKRFNQFLGSMNYQALAKYEQLDAILLSHLMASVAEDGNNSSFLIFQTLLPGPSPDQKAPPVCFAGKSSISAHSADAIYSRFGNNNFAIHSHLTTFAHGIFPIASRLFNHSCTPNAAPKYILKRNCVPRMEVVALRDITEGEEICIPYLDPALVQSRQRIFQLTYGFTCRCQSCSFIECVNSFSFPTNGDGNSREVVREEGLVYDKDLARQIRDFAFPNGISDPSALTSTIPFGSVPQSLFAAIHESYLTRLSTAFGNASHDGPYVTAVEAGVTILGLYKVIYPPNYPQIGMHLLELSKVQWNAFITAPTAQLKYLTQTRVYLAGASEILSIYGREGDEGGPLEEIRNLESLLRTEDKAVAG